MIRDGLTLKNKKVLRHWKSVQKDEPSENLLSSVINAQKMYLITKVAKSFAYIKDP